MGLHKLGSTNWRLSRFYRAGKADQDLFLLVIALSVFFERSYAARRLSYFGQDGRVVWQAAHDLIEGRNVYAPHSHLLPYIYPPLATVLSAPLGLLSQNVSIDILWAASVVSFVTLAAAITILMKPLEHATIVFAGVLLFEGLVEPVHNAIANTNPTFLVAAMLPVILIRFGPSTSTSAVAILAFSLALKPLLVPVVIIVILRRNAKEISTLGASLAALLILPLAVVPGGFEFFRSVLPKILEGDAGNLGPNNESLAGIGHTFGVSIELIPIRVAIICISVLIASRIWQGTSQQNCSVEEIRRKYLWVSGVLLIATFLAGGVYEEHYGTLLIPMFAATLLGPREGFKPVFLGLGIVLTCLPPPLPHLAGTLLASTGLWRAIGLALFLCGLHRLRSHRRIGEAEELTVVGGPG